MDDDETPILDLIEAERDRLTAIIERERAALVEPLRLDALIEDPLPIPQRLLDLAPLSVREGGWRKRAGWRSRLFRERLALRIAPWLLSADRWAD